MGKTARITIYSIKLYFNKRLKDKSLKNRMCYGAFFMSYIQYNSINSVKSINPKYLL